MPMQVNTVWEIFYIHTTTYYLRISIQLLDTVSREQKFYSF
jgi:hypothetical protein